jgi:hypothetical protein
MKRNEAIEAIINYYEENEEQFFYTIEELDSYNGILGDDRYYNMAEIDIYYEGVEPSELMNRIFYGHDEDTWTTDASGNKEYGEFNPNREYFTYNGYGNLVSTNYKDYSDHLDRWFAEDLIENKSHLYEVPAEVEEIIDSIED